MNKRSISILLLVLCVSAFQLWADPNKVGEVQTTTGAVVAVTQGEKRPLLIKSALFETDMVAVGENSSVQIMFKDGTVLVMQENSELEIRQFAYEVGNADASLVDLNMLAGGIRFLTGKAVKGNPEGFQVTTPLGTIGIRGTEGTATTELSNTQGYSGSLNKGINAPGSGWDHNVPPEVSKQTVNHVDGSAKRTMTFTDRFKKTVRIGRGQGVSVNKETGAGEAKPIEAKTKALTKPTMFNKKAHLPKQYKRSFEGYEGGGRNSNNLQGGSGGNAEKVESHTDPN